MLTDDDLREWGIDPCCSPPRLAVTEHNLKAMIGWCTRKGRDYDHIRDKLLEVLGGLICLSEFGPKPNPGGYQGSTSK
jgi:hypothetical protein